MKLFPAILLLFGSLLMAQAPKKAGEDGNDAEAVAEEWLEQLGEKGLVLEESDAETPFKGSKIAGRESAMYVFQKEGWYVNLGFEKPLTDKTTTAEAQKALKYVALDRLPTPGLEIPGWEVRPRTPVSSFKKGVVIESIKDGVLTLRVKTEFFALSGRDPNVLVPADAPSPPGSYFQIRQKFPLDLTLKAKLKHP